MEETIFARRISKSNININNASMLQKVIYNVTPSILASQKKSSSVVLICGLKINFDSFPISKLIFELWWFLHKSCNKVIPTIGTSYMKNVLMKCIISNLQVNFYKKS